MRTKNSIFILAALIVTSSILMFSCKKEKADSDTTGAADNNLAENAASDIISIGSQASDNSSGGLVSFRTGSDDQVLSSCATVTRDTVARTITVVFSGSTCLDGRTRSGSLVFNFSGSTNGARYFRDPGFNCSITATNYIVDGNHITINNKSITNTTPVGFNPTSTNETWHILADISILKANGETVGWVCDRTTTLLNTSTTYTNASTPINWLAARIGIMGSANGTRANGETFSIVVISQLVRDFGACNVNGRHPFIQGSLDYAPSGKPVRHVDFGNGSCDLNATVMINNVTYNVVLP